MGLIIKPKSKIKAFGGRLFNWATLGAVLRDEPLIIAWADIHDIQVVPDAKDPEYVIRFQFPDGLHSRVHVFTTDVVNFAEFDSYLNAHPAKVCSRHNLFKENIKDLGWSHFIFGAPSLKYIVISLAVVFVFYQLKYFGFMLIDKYQFLVKASCNQQCANTLWNISFELFFNTLYFSLPLAPLLFYKRIYQFSHKSKNVQTINSTLLETAMLAVVGVFFMTALSPKLWEFAKRYSTIVADYSNNTLQSKLSQKIEMASKRKFEGDIDENPDLDYSREN